MTFADIQRDLIHALRGLRRAPGFTVLVTTTLGVGVGGAVATFSVLDRVLFRPPEGVRAPDAVRRIYRQHRFPGIATITTSSLSYPDFADLAAAARDRAVLAGYGTVGRRLGTEGSLVRVSFVTRDYFSLLDVRPLRGRLFTPDETRPISPAVHPAVLSATLWHREFGGDSSVIGRTVLLSGRAYTVVGIAPSGFRGLDHNPVDAWAPIGSVEMGPEGGTLSDRGRFGWEVIARMESGAWTDLTALLTVQLRESQRGEPWADSAARVITTPLLDPWGPVLRPTLERRNASLAVRLVFVSIAVMLVAVLHGAIMLSLRAVHRRREIAIRLAFGMSRLRLVMYHAVEAACVAFLAGGVAALLGWWGASVLDARVLSTLRPAELGLDGRLMMMTMLLSVLVLVMTGLMPALTSRRISPMSLRADGLAGDAAGSTLRASLVAAQTAGCVALVMLAGVSLRSLQRIAVADFGYDGAHLVTFAGPLGSNALGVRDAIASLPFVAAVSAMTSESPADGMWGRFAIPERPAIPDSLVPTYNVVDAEFLSLAGIRLEAGRGLSATDVAGAQNVVVITRAMADLFWPDASPLGQCVLVMGNFTTCRYVVGVVVDVRKAIGEPVRPQIFAPIAQAGEFPTRHLLIRTRRPAIAADAAEIERATQPAFAGYQGRAHARRVVDALEPELAPLRAASTLFLVFGVLALVSAAGGVYGLISYHVSRRTREIGIRMALGASAPDVARIVARWVATPFAIGIVTGTAAALAGGRLIAAFLFETSAYDPLILSGVTAVVCVAAGAAAIGPAWRAARIDPAAALRHD